MKEQGIHEGSIEQIQRLYSERLFLEQIPTDSEGRIRIDDLEMRSDMQNKIAQLWKLASTTTLPSIGDVAGYKTEFFNPFGFNYDEIDYDIEADEMVGIPGLQ